MSMREIQAKYTKSELAVQAWRSSEVVHNMAVSRPQLSQGRGNDGKHSYDGRAYALPDPQLEALENRLGEAIVTAMVDEDGEIDVGRLTGDQAVHYLRAMGLPIMPGLTRRSVEDPDVVEAHRIKK